MNSIESGGESIPTGGSLSGTIIWALDGTDIHSGWTEVRAVWNRGAYATCEQMSDIEQALPFALRMLHFRNGSDFLNAHFISTSRVATLQWN